MKEVSQKGFSLLEILVALSLMAMVFLMATNVNFTYRQTLEETINNLERAVRLGVSEATIRNTMVRLHFDMTSDPQQWALEYGPDSSFVLPAKAFQTKEGLGLKESEELDQDLDKLNKKFNRIKEFSDGAREMEPDIRIVGFSSDNFENLILDFQASLYIYPTGEKDAGLIVVASPDEVIGLSIEPFTQQIERQYVTLPEGDQEDLTERQLNAAEEIYEEWKRNRI